MLTVKVLGPGCANCHKLEELTRAAATQLGIEAQFEKVTDRVAINSYHILATPGLVVNEKVVSAGRIPTIPEITTWLTNAMMTN